MTLPPFRNLPLLDFSDPKNVQAMEEALANLRANFGKKYPLVIDGEEVWTDETFDSINPADPDQVIGTFSKATPELVDKAVRAAYEAFEAWRKVPYTQRARHVLQAAAEIRRRRHELNAIMVYEVGKNWVEADADTAELIDAMEYYARLMYKYGPSQPVEWKADEEVDYFYIPLGVVAVIPPWNFPAAIMGAMTTAAIITGNTAVLKPASNAPLTAYWFAQRLWETGLPKGVLNFLPGPGGAIGDALVDHPLTRMIAFTGSKEVGLRIFERAAKVHPGQKWLKRTILEMGGKDAIVVDETADLDAAAEGIVISAYGFQGQKCSAASRVIAVEEIYDALLEKVVERAKKIVIGPPEKKENWMGPVIDARAMEKILNYIEIGKGEGRLVLGGRRLDRKGYFIEPTIFADVDPNARIAQEEIFGPVLAFIKAKDFEHAIEIANGTEYGLTGAVYSRDRGRLEYARCEFHVGNLYFNRKCTGALIGAHPFGGFNMSGTDSKAGGPEYLLLFMQAKSVGDKL